MDRGSDLRVKVDTRGAKEVHPKPIKKHAAAATEEFWGNSHSSETVCVRPAEPTNLPRSVRRQLETNFVHPPCSAAPGSFSDALPAFAELSDHRFSSKSDSLRTFAQYCDSTGLRIPSDSTDFRNNFLDPPKVMEYIHLPKKTLAVPGILRNHGAGPAPRAEESTSRLES